jgi:hypothetical protein
MYSSLAHILAYSNTTDFPAFIIRTLDIYYSYCFQIEQNYLQYFYQGQSKRFS